MGREYIKLRSTGDRERELDRAKANLDVDQDAEAIELALTHLNESIENLEELKRELTPEQAEQLSTSAVSLTMYPQIRR